MKATEQAAPGGWWARVFRLFFHFHAVNSAEDERNSMWARPQYGLGYEQDERLPRLMVKHSTSRPKEPSRRSGEERNHDRPTKWQWSVDARVARNIARRSGHGQRRSRARRALFLALLVLLGPLLLIPQRVGEDLGQKLRTAKGAVEVTREEECKFPGIETSGMTGGVHIE